LFVLAQIKVFVCLLINLHRLYAHVHSLEIQQAQLAWLLTVTSWNIFFFSIIACVQVTDRIDHGGGEALA
jgi:hypothetical protein